MEVWFKSQQNLFVCLLKKYSHDITSSTYAIKRALLKKAPNKLLLLSDDRKKTPKIQVAEL